MSSYSTTPYARLGAPEGGDMGSQQYAAYAPSAETPAAPAPSAWRRLRWALLALFIVAGVIVGLAIAGIFHSKKNPNSSIDYTSVKQLQQVMESFMDPTVDPCNDFYMYMCGGYIRDNRPSLSTDTPAMIYSFDRIQASIQAQMISVFSDSTPAMSTYLTACLNEAGDSRDWRDLARPMMEAINGIESASDALRVLGMFQRRGLAYAAFVTPVVGPNVLEATVNRFWLVPIQSELNQFNPAVNAVITNFFTLLQGAGFVTSASTSTSNFFSMADVLMSAPFPQQPGDPNAAVMNSTAAVFLTSFNFSLEPYFQGLRGATPQQIIYYGPQFWSGVGQFFGQPGSVAMMQDYLRFHVLYGLFDYMPDQMRDIANQLSNANAPRSPYQNIEMLTERLRPYVRFDGVLGGFVSGRDKAFFRKLGFTQPGVAGSHLEIASHRFVRRANGRRAEIRPSDAFSHEDQCMSDRAQVWHEFFIAQWVQKYFAADKKPFARSLVNTIIQMMTARLQTVSWLDAPTRQQALLKMSQLVANVAYDDTWEDFSSLNIVGLEFEDFLAVRNYTVNKDLLAIDTPVIRNEFQPGMDVNVPNAFYYPLTNTINMLAGLMFSPFFNDKLPMLLTMAPYGMVIGHEITHGFDNNGRLFDGVGAYRNWWTPTAEQQFMARAQCLIDQYDGFNIEGAQVNGSQTLGENIADLGGVGNAYRGMMSGNYTPNIMPPYTNEQVFFMTIAMSWCEVALPQVYAYQVENDPHSPAPFRIRGPFSNFPGFAQAFSCASTSVYGRSLTAAKCELW